MRIVRHKVSAKEMTWQWGNTARSLFLQSNEKNYPAGEPGKDSL